MDIESYLVMPNPLQPSPDCDDSSYLPSQTDESVDEIGSTVDKFTAEAKKDMYFHVEILFCAG